MSDPALTTTLNSILHALNRIANATEAIAKKTDPTFKTLAEKAQPRR